MRRLLHTWNNCSALECHNLQSAALPDGTRWPVEYFARPLLLFYQSSRNQAHQGNKPSTLRLSLPRLSDISSLLQPRLLQDVIRRPRREIIARIAGNRNQPRLRRVLVLMVAAFGSYPIPAVPLNELDEVSYLHASTIVGMRHAVNSSPCRESDSSVNRLCYRAKDYSPEALIRCALQSQTSDSYSALLVPRRPSQDCRARQIRLRCRRSRPTLCLQSLCSSPS